MTITDEEVAKIVQISGPINSATGGLIVTDTFFNQVQLGNSFTFSHLVPVGSEIANDANLDIVFTTNAKSAFIRFTAASDGTFEAYLYRDVVFSGGTPLLVRNINDSRPDPSESVVTLLPVISNVGDQRSAGLVPGGGRVQSLIGTSGEGFFNGFKTNTSYLIRATNRAGSAAQMSMSGHWVEGL